MRTCSPLGNRIGIHYGVNISIVSVSSSDPGFSMLNSGEVDSTAKVLLLFTNSATNTLVGIAGSTGDARRSLAYRPACAVHAQRLYFISKRVASVSTATEFRKMINENLMLSEPVTVSNQIFG